MAAKSFRIGLVGTFVIFLITLKCSPSPGITPTATSVPPTPTPVPPTATPLPPTPIQLPQGFKELRINSHKLLVEVANTPEKQTKGLGERDSLPKNQGMLFIFPSEAYYALWMKGMRFPLDFIWISANKKVVDMAYQIPPEPGKPDLELKIYSPRQPCLYILEINSGLAQEYNFQIGDSVEF